MLVWFPEVLNCGAGSGAGGPVRRTADHPNRWTHPLGERGRVSESQLLTVMTSLLPHVSELNGEGSRADQVSGFELVQLDGGEPVRLPPGDSVLGRGPLLGISDKRVSRHHGLLENLEGELRLKPTHINPCFVQSSLTDDPRPLQRDVWHRLQDGDLFSLLPGRLVYQVVAVGGAQHTPSQMFEEPPASLQPDEEPAPVIGQDGAQTTPQEEAPPPSLPHQERVDRPTGRTQEDQRGVALEPRRRSLPAWMMAAVAPHSSSSFSPRGSSGVKGRKGAAGKRAKTSPPEEEEEEEEEVKKMRRKIPDEEDVAPPTTVESPPCLLFSGGPGGGATLTRVSVLQVPEGRPGGSSRSRVRTEGEEEGGGATSRPAPPTSNSGPTAPPPQAARPPCPYGKDCYRKNPLHFQESSHPGDPDYEEEEEEDDDDRPECPYGNGCYRKNPLHRKEYKHTQRPATRTRTAPQKSPASDEDEVDSFIDDDSADAGDDSDYVPPDSDDGGKEELELLQREAKNFLRKRK
ncbi:aprataxin and PNK-like factor isoform X2 [Antennarius striatus]|uniref:aprataxin and PNK-like factor isoform X2 n=1 Tax=Antennarius striatus TaxID=241820 RepID=UPI0035ADDA31